MVVVAWVLAGFFCGSIPFSLIVGRRAKKIDIRQYGDRNPGAWNVMRAAGWQWGLVAGVLDYLKGAIPVGLAWFWAGIDGWQMVLVALSPLFGHAFSPFLRFRGGKAVATTFGVWTGLTVWAGPTVMGLLLGLFYFLLESSAWAVILTFLIFGGIVAVYFLPANPEFGWIWLGNFALLFWRHHKEITHSLKFRQGMLKAFGRPR
jgi:acyl phosphate:glycerol-3-phosphate acyltransferase